MTDTLLGLVRQFLEDFTYKPDTSFHLNMDIYGVIIVASRDLPDSRDPDYPMIKVMGQLVVPESIMQAAYDPRDLLQNLVHDWILSMERHEADEWFRVAGALPYDPHR